MPVYICSWTCLHHSVLVEIWEQLPQIGSLLHPFFRHPTEGRLQSKCPTCVGISPTPKIFTNPIVSLYIIVHWALRIYGKWSFCHDYTHVYSLTCKAETHSPLWNTSRVQTPWILMRRARIYQNVLLGSQGLWNKNKIDPVKLYFHSLVNRIVYWYVFFRHVSKYHKVRNTN